MKLIKTLLLLATVFTTPLLAYNSSETKETKETQEQTEKTSTEEIQIKRNVIDIINNINDSTMHNTFVNVSPAIVNVLNKQFSTAKKTDGYRLQIYSSNNGQTARKKAFEIEKKIKQGDDEMSVYVTYESPFWKVRVGNCIDKDDAATFRQYFIEKFPDFITGTYIVPSQIEAN